MDFLTKELEKAFENKYLFLKLLEVVYDKNKKTCTIVFLFPESKDEMNEEERKEVETVVTSLLDINSKVIIKYKKSFLDESLVIREVLAFLKKNFQSCSANITRNNISCERNEENVNIVKLLLAQSVYNFFKNGQFCDELNEYLKRVFIGEFQIVLKCDEKIKIDENILKEKENEIYSTLLYKPKNIVKRYQVCDVFMLFGNEISPNPEHISNIKEEKQSVILSGTISYFSKKSYTKKREKAKGENAKQNSFYTFRLADEGGSIGVTYFSNKTTEKKMDKLCDGTRILCVGDVKTFNNQKTLYIKSLGFCDKAKAIASENYNKTVDALPRQYIMTKPIPYTIKEQENFLATNICYSSFVLSNKFVVYDFETTGLLYDKDDIIEIGACKIVDGKIVETFQTLVSTDKILDDKIVGLTGIDNTMLVNAPSIEIALHDFNVFCEGCILVGYNNLDFDAKFLQYHSNKHDVRFDNEQKDAYILSRAKLSLSKYKLGSVVKELGIVLVDAHRALNDALATAKVFLQLNEIENQ